MKTTTVKFVVSVLMITMLSLTAPAQTTQRIKFARGKDTATRVRTLPANGFVRYILSARKGQSMHLTPNGDESLQVSVFDKNDLVGHAEINQTNSFRLTVDGDYTITILNSSKRSQRVFFEVAVSSD